MNYIWGIMILAGILYGTLTGNIDAVSEAVLTSSKEAVSLCITMLGVMALWMGLMEIARSAGLVQSISGRIRPLVRFLFPHIPDNHPAVEHITLNFVANFLGLGWAATPAGLKAMESLAELEEERREEHVTAAQEMEERGKKKVTAAQKIEERRKEHVTAAQEMEERRKENITATQEMRERRKKHVTATQEMRRSRAASEKMRTAADVPETGQHRTAPKRMRHGIMEAMPRGVASNEMCTFLILNISSLQLIPVNVIAYRSQYGSVNPTAIVGPGIAATAVSTGVAIVFCKMLDKRKQRI